MIVNKKSLHYKVYRWTYQVGGTEYLMGETTDLCHYTQRLLWRTPLSVLFWVGAYLLYLVITPFAALFGYRPTNIWAEAPVNFKWVNYPGIRVWGQVRLHPWVLAIPTAIIFGEWYWYHTMGWLAPTITQALVIISLVLLQVFMWFKYSDNGNLVGEWIDAKKVGICPIIHFKDEE